MTSKIYRRITPIVDSSDSETELNHSVFENINPANMKTPYSTSKSRLKRRNTNVPAEDDVELHTPLSSKINHRITPIADSSDSETELYHSVFEDRKATNMKTPSSTSRRRRKRRIISINVASDDEEETDRSNDSRVNR